MRLVDLTLPTPEANLALDEALFCALDDALESGGDPEAWETLRFWESPSPFVVVGRSDRVEEAVEVEACREAGVSVHRRASGGGAVLLGPGCLCFSLVLSYRARAAVRDVAESYRIILGRTARALEVHGLARRGEADLALGDRKVSGNAQHRGRYGLLHQGTLLHAFEPALLGRLLREPRRQPAYRAGRRHVEFVGNLPVSGPEMKSRLARAWQVRRPPTYPDREGGERRESVAY